MPPDGRRLRIAFVVHDYHRHGGHARYTAELAGRFKRDHEVHVFANTFDDPDPAGITYHHVPAWRRSALTTVLSFVLPGTALVRGPFDIVHAQGLCGLRHNVATAHICQSAWYEALERSAGRLTWKQRAFRALVVPLERWALAQRSTRRVIAISNRVRDDLARFYRRTNGVTVIYHGIDLDTFRPGHPAREAVRAELGLTPGDCVALFVGHLQKGAAAAIRAARQVPGLRLVLVSSSDPAPEREVARAEGVADRVAFHPPTRQIDRLYAAADVFVFPTQYDAFGMVISEAMATGLPVVTSREAGAAELITHGVDGWLTDDPWAVEQIAGGLRALAADPERRARMGRAARATIEAHTWDRVAAETMAVYREVAAERER
jgi:UDP-glucose:(heptosyl)LPS alpha-1,3-glucosyltransferase